MNKTSLTLIALIVILLGIGIFLGRNDAHTVAEKDAEVASEQEGQRRKFNVQYSYEEGTHTFAGIVNLPTPCHAITVSSTEDADGVMLDVAIENPEEGCAQVVTAKSFIYSVEGAELVNPLGKVNNEIVEINLFPRDTAGDIDLSQFDSKG